MLTTRQRLEILEEIFIQNNSPILKHLNPGLDKSEIELFFKENNIYNNRQLLSVYEWHNGVKSVYGVLDPLLELIPFGKLFNLTELLQIRNIFFEWGQEDFPGRPLEDYLPFIGSGESDMFLLNLKTGQIFCYQPMIQIFGELAFNSIDKMLDCIIECYSTSAFTTDPVSGLEMDWRKYEIISQKHLLIE
ncbi:hypothetical protein [Pinibacter soli]|uniref:SMI1/KNR4 family protein n=1 Tax=Pinibacter soli TaxID=3044211 RepID=A0ABT6R9P5_9BACT|nr:hypothetical protein [Pinibacter soli]MDI3319270.1 hypothetical protein [Pinibacter soli]